MIYVIAVIFIVCMYNCKLQGTFLEGINIYQLTTSKASITISKEDVGPTCLMYACESTANNFIDLVCLGIMGKNAD